MAKLFFAMFLILNMAISAYGEILILKTGQTIEGKIVEKTDTYVKIDFYGIFLTYYHDEIERIIDDATPVDITTAPSNDSTKTEDALQENGDSIAWKEWSLSVTDYFDKVDMLQERGKDVALESAHELARAMKSGDNEEAGKIVIATGNALDALIQELSNIVPPADFRVYHKKIIESYEYRKKANDAILRDDQQAAQEYHQISLTIEMESVQEAKRVFGTHGAPRRVLDAFDVMIADYKRRMTG